MTTLVKTSANLPAEFKPQEAKLAKKEPHEVQRAGSGW